MVEAIVFVGEPGFLRHCEMDFVHPDLVWLLSPPHQRNRRKGSKRYLLAVFCPISWSQGLLHSVAQSESAFQFWFAFLSRSPKRLIRYFQVIWAIESRRSAILRPRLSASTTHRAILKHCITRGCSHTTSLRMGVLVLLTV